jgi:hypothetical protein
MSNDSFKLICLSYSLMLRRKNIFIFTSPCTRFLTVASFQKPDFIFIRSGSPRPAAHRYFSVGVHCFFQAKSPCSVLRRRRGEPSFPDRQSAEAVAGGR